jgi:hypothetical protein
VSGEEVGGAAVGEPGPAAVVVQVNGGHRSGGLSVGQEHRPVVAAGEQAGQELGGAGLPEHPIGGSTLGAHPGPFVSQVHVGDVEGENLARPGGGLVEQSPQGLLSQPDVAGAPQAVDWARVSARVRSGCSRLRSRETVGSASSQPCATHQRVAERRVASSRFHVAGAAASCRATNQPTTVSASRVSSGRSGPRPLLREERDAV